LVAARFIIRPLGDGAHRAGFGLILQAWVTSEFNRVWVVTFTGSCRIIDSYRVAVSWTPNSGEWNLWDVHRSERVLKWEARPVMLLFVIVVSWRADCYRWSCFGWSQILC
jgi:hypothetical protein